MATYRGFSTVNELSQKKFRLVDYELIKQDLLNALNTPRGARVMQPNFGCIVWELLYEPLTEGVQQRISDNLTEIVNSDPRLTFHSVQITTDASGNGLTAELIVSYTATNQLLTMIVQFDRSGAASIIA